MKNVVFWDVLQLLVTASVVPSSTIVITLMMEAISSFETPVLTRVTQRNIPEDGILHLMFLVTLFSICLELSLK
jgi:hypothetical protein